MGVMLFDDCVAVVRFVSLFCALVVGDASFFSFLKLFFSFFCYLFVDCCLCYLFVLCLFPPYFVSYFFLSVCVAWCSLIVAYCWCYWLLFV